MKDTRNFDTLPKEKFALANKGDFISDTVFKDKPIGSFKDAWIRFRRNKASIVAAGIILIIFLFAFLTPLFTFGYDSTFLDPYYAKMGPRNLTLAKIGIATGASDYDGSEKNIVRVYSIGAAALDTGDNKVAIKDTYGNMYQPVREITGTKTQFNLLTQRDDMFYTAKVDPYLNIGFIYKDIEQAEYYKILAWQEETGIQVLYPLIASNKYNPGAPFEHKQVTNNTTYYAGLTNPNDWYKSSQYTPLKDLGNGRYSEQNLANGVDIGDVVFEDNYLRDAEGNLVYFKNSSGGTSETSQFKVRILYYNYYRYKNGFEPEYIFGTDSQGYDLALRMADGVRLSLLIAICVSMINFVIGAAYGAIEGYYGGVVDLTLERVSDILAGVPFMIVATLFQLHLAKQVGAIPSLLFAFVMTGWIGTASRVRTQFYRFKNQEYVMAARTLGARDARIIWKHIFPNSLGTIITSSVLVIPGVIFSESMLSFLGIVNLGGSKSTSLGTLLSEASGLWTNYPHLMLFPALIISLLMISFNLFGNGLRDAFNPSLRGVEE